MLSAREFAGTGRVALMMARKHWIFAAAGVAALALSGCAGVSHVRDMAWSPCRHDTTVTLYFDTGQDTVTDIGQQIVTATARRLRACTVKEIRLVGLADASGAAQANLDLSKRRADNVLHAFVVAGLPVPKYSLVAAGDKGAVNAQGAAEPVRRRVDVVVSVQR
jgi:peptidoglycan-associated lipoprotein